MYIKYKYKEYPFSLNFSVFYKRLIIIMYYDYENLIEIVKM